MGGSGRGMSALEDPGDRALALKRLRLPWEDARHANEPCKGTTNSKQQP